MPRSLAASRVSRVLLFGGLATWMLLGARVASQASPVSPFPSCTSPPSLAVLVASSDRVWAGTVLEADPSSDPLAWIAYVRVVRVLKGPVVPDTPPQTVRIRFARAVEPGEQNRVRSALTNQGFVFTVRVQGTQVTNLWCGQPLQASALTAVERILHSTGRPPLATHRTSRAGLAISLLIGVLVLASVLLLLRSYRRGIKPQPDAG